MATTHFLLYKKPLNIGHIVKLIPKVKPTHNRAKNDTRNSTKLK